MTEHEVGAMVSVAIQHGKLQAAARYTPPRPLEPRLPFLREGRLFVLGSAESPFRVLSLLDEEPVLSAGGTMQWVPLRRRLGIRAFGTNAFRAARAGDPVVEDHVESPGQEELYVVVAGRALVNVDDQEIDASAGTAVFVERPEARRSAVALEDVAQESMRQGDWAGAAEILEREAGEHRHRARPEHA